MSTLRRLVITASFLLPLATMTACDPPIHVPGATPPPGSVNDTLSVDPGTLPPPPPPPITNVR